MPQTSELITLIRSRIPLVKVETNEELEAMIILEKAAGGLSRPLFLWTITEGLRRIDGAGRHHESPMDPSEILQHIWAVKISGIYLLVDFHPYLEDPRHVRMLKEVALYAEKRNQTIVFLSHQIELPTELRSYSASFEMKLPGKKALRQMVARIAGEWAKESEKNYGPTLRVNKEALHQLVEGLAGLSVREAERLARTAIYDDGALTMDDLPEVAKAKYALLNQEEVLSFEYDTAQFHEVGGLRRFKEWLDQRRRVFVGTEHNHGLDPPKGVLLLGVQGGGKSLAAKAVAGTWRIPLLRLDFGALFNKYFGETERRTREALRMAETMSPCVLWLDEIEKGVATGDSDNGTSRRLLATLLTWMAERKAPVFIVATANDIQALPPELMRKGRLDEIFFVDLPDFETRQEIFRIHLTKRNLEPAGYDLEALAQASEGFSGSEIEQAIVSGLYAAQEEPGLPHQTLVHQIETTRPLSVVMREHIDYMRNWAQERTVAAH